MGIYIHGMEMPTEDEEIIIRISPDGIVTTEYALPITGVKAIPVPDHGRLIDGDALFEAFDPDNKPKSEWGYTPWYVAKGMTEEMPTIIPAEEGET